MDKQSIFFTGLVAIFSIAIMIMLIKLITKKIFNDNENQNISYIIWFSSILISFTLLLKIALDFIENSIDILIFIPETTSTFLLVMEKISIFVGFTFLVTFFSYYLVNYILRIVFNFDTIKFESNNNNVNYFIINGLCLVLFVCLIVNIFEHFLKWFMPVVETPFYH
jgi:hypothetical protein